MQTKREESAETGQEKQKERQRQYPKSQLKGTQTEEQQKYQMICVEID